MNCKYPTLAVRGDAVSTDQAAEILIRCDAFSFGINEVVERRVWRALGIGPRPEWPRKGSNRRRKQKLAWWNRIVMLEHNRVESLMDALGCLRLKELETHRIMSSTRLSGWCDWGGTIDSAFATGKWPDPASILEDFQTIAATWPFLRMTAQLYDAHLYDVGTEEPVWNFLVADGEARMEPATGVLFAPKRPPCVLASYVEREPGESIRAWQERSFRAYAPEMLGVDLDVLRGHVQRLRGAAGGAMNQQKEKRFQDLLKLARMLHADGDKGRRDAILDLLPPDDVIRLDMALRVLASDVPFAVPYPYEGGWIIKRASCGQYLLHSASMWMLSPHRASAFDLRGARLTIAEMQIDGIAWCTKWPEAPPCRFREGHEGPCDR